MRKVDQEQLAEEITPYQERMQIKRDRKESAKARDLDRKEKRDAKRKPWL